MRGLLDVGFSRVCFLLALGVHMASPAYAYCPVPPEPRTEEIRQAYEAATLIALVRVLRTHYAIEDRDDSGRFVGLVSLTEVEAQARLAAGFQPRDPIDAAGRILLVADVQVLKLWKGPAASLQTVATWPTLGSEGMPFAPDQEWLVFADGPDYTGLAQVISCSPTSLKQSASGAISILDKQRWYATSHQ